MLKRILTFILTAVLLFSLASCGKKPKEEEPTEPVTASVLQLCSPSEGDTVVTIITDTGTIRAVIYKDLVPATAGNFISLAESEWLFHLSQLTDVEM